MSRRAPVVCAGPLSRREMLQAGALALGGVTVADVLSAKSLAASAQTTQPDTSVIFIWLPGGPAHMETYDLKPNAPSDYRGLYRPIATNVPGIDVCEKLPLHAKVADKYALIRSCAHNFADHGGGHKRFLTGRDPNEPAGFVNDHPMVGSMVAKLRENTQRGLPNYIAGTDGGRQGIDVFSFGSSYLGPSTHPFMVVGDPSESKFQVENVGLQPGLEKRLDDRISLLRGFDRMDGKIDRKGSMDAIGTFHDRAVNFVTNEQARHAFDLTKEAAEVRERYGMHRYGQRCLMARRLVEAGASWVTMVLENPGNLPPETCYNWDSHAVNCNMYTDYDLKLPMYDQAITALVEDLYARGLDKKVLLVVTGEFGRTPRVEHYNGRPGRDHWPQAMSMLVSGGGLKMGQIVGSTNSKGEHPKDRPLTPNDLWATVFRHIGVDPLHTSFADHSGRPMPVLPYGNVIHELV